MKGKVLAEAEPGAVAEGAEMKLEAEYMESYEGTDDEQRLMNLQDHCALLALPHMMRQDPQRTEFFFDLGDRTMSYEYDCHCAERGLR